MHTSVVRSALQDIADAQTDVDAYIALVPVQDRSRPQMGAEIGRRLLAAGRTIEALAVLENARPNKRAGQAGYNDDFYRSGYGDGGAWEEVYIEALDESRCIWSRNRRASLRFAPLLPFELFNPSSAMKPRRLLPSSMRRLFF